MDALIQNTATSLVTGKTSQQKLGRKTGEWTEI
jgi:hypothetical protein